MSEATDFDLAADDWRCHGANVFRGDYADEGEPDVWITVAGAEEPETIAKRIASALNAYGRQSRPPFDPSLPTPRHAPEIIMDARGIYWRRWPQDDEVEGPLGGGYFSMVPVSSDNLPVPEPYVVYHPVGIEQHIGEDLARLPLAGRP